MFGIGFGELLLLAAIGIIVLGPQRCVDVAKRAGKLWRTVIREWNRIKDDISLDDKK